MSSVLRNNVRFIFTLSLFLIGFTLIAQDDKEEKKEIEENLINFEEPDFLLEQDSLKYDKKKKKKRKKKTFNGLKTRRGFTRKGAGRRQTVQLFYYLKKYREPSKYVKPIYLFDRYNIKLVEADDYNKKDYPPRQFKILHGPYKMKVDTHLVEIGYFYIGTKHHRWEKYDRDDIVIEKTHYYKGWPGDSKISYYDAEKKKPKEVNPIMFGENTGWYYSYFENGNVEKTGFLEGGVKVGRWTEFWKETGKRKKVVQYPKDPYEKNREPEVMGEWEKNGRVKGATNNTRRKLGRGR